MDYDFNAIARNLSLELGTMIQTRPYIGIFDYNGNILYGDKELDKFLQLISEYIGMNFKLLRINDHGIPFSGKNLVVFKVTNKAAVAIYTVHGYVAQLLSFKQLMDEYADKIGQKLINLKLPEEIEELKEETAEIEEISEEPEKFKVFPTYTDKFKANDKFAFQEMSVLQYCDGNHSLREICEKTTLKKGEIFEVLENYLDKKKIKYKLEGDPIYCPYLFKKITPKDIKLGIVSKEQLEISNYCDGKTTVKKIQENLARDGLAITYEEFKNAVNELIKKKYMRMRFCVE